MISFRQKILRDSQRNMQLMGILNVTPDSFFESIPDPHLAAQKARSMAADIIDVGGESTRPGSLPVSLEEELARVLPVLDLLQGLNLSIDTTKPEVASQALRRGCTLINDVKGLADPAMRQVAGEAQATVIVMHSRGSPATMQMMTSYEEGVVDHLLLWFEQRLSLLRAEGFCLEKIILDPGIGFAKTAAQNIEILQGIPRLKSLGFPLLIGLSRKAFLKNSLISTLAANTYALLQGADIVRVHDVKETRELIDFLVNIKKIQ